MTEDNEFSFGQFERFCRSTGDLCRQLKIWMWVSRVDWPKSIDLGPSASG